MHFDWYQATVEATTSALIDGLGFDTGAVDIDEGNGRHGFTRSDVLRGADGEKLATILSGGNTHPNVQGSGVHAEDVARSLRRRWPQHNVTRCDAAEDMIGQGSFDQLHEVCRRVSSSSRIKGRMILPDDLDDGRTYYMGSSTSTAQARLYDKTAERRAKLPAQRHQDIPEGWTRLEVQLRPRKAHRAAFAGLTSSQVWGMAKWTLLLAQTALALDIERLARLPPEVSDDERTFEHMLRQFGPTLARMVANQGEDRILRRIRDGVRGASKR